MTDMFEDLLPDGGYVHFVETVNADTNEPVLALAMTVDLLHTQEDEMGRQVFLLPMPLADAPEYLGALVTLGMETAASYTASLALFGGPLRIEEFNVRCADYHAENPELDLDDVTEHIAKEMGIPLPRQ